MIMVLYILLLLTEHHGQVMFAGFPVPGATVTAEQGDKKFIAITDQQGVYSFPELAEGPFTIRVEMLGFSTISQEVNAAAAEFEMKMLPIEEIHAETVHAAARDPAPAPAASSNTKAAAAQPRPQAGFERTEVNASRSDSDNSAPAAMIHFLSLVPSQT